MSQACPTYPELVAFDVGSASEEAIARIAAHLEGCPACCAVLAGLAKKQGIAKGLIPKADLQQYREEGAYVEAAERIRGLNWVVPASNAGCSSGTLPGHVGGYRLIREIGRGRLGVVYEAIHETLDRFVALKVLTAAATLEPAVMQRFRRDAQVAAQLHHTHIVPIYEVGRDGDVWYYVTRFIDGQSLEAWRRAIAEGKGAGNASSRGVSDDFRRVARVALQVAEGLDHAHQRGILHRDIHPASVLLDTSGVAWIADFGLGKFKEAARAAISSDAVLSRFLAPERLTSGGDARGDLYGLGAIMYEWLTMRPLFDASDAAELRRQIANDEPVPVRQIEPRIPEELARIVGKCLEKTTQQRYQTARQLANDLERLVTDLSFENRSATRSRRSARWGRPPQSLTAALMVAAALLLASTLFYVDAARRARGLAVQESQAREQVEKARDAESRRRQDVELSRRQTEQTLADVLASAGFQADGRGEPAEAILWFANAAQYSGSDLTRADFNARRVWSWSQQVATPLQTLGRVSLPQSPFEIRFHPREPYLMVTCAKKSTAPATGSHRIVRHDLPDPEPVLVPLMQSATAVDFSPDGRRLAAFVPGKGLVILEFPSGKTVAECPLEQFAAHVAFSPNGQRIAIMVGQNLRIWDQQLLPLEVAHPGPVDTINWHESSGQLATGCRDGKARLIDLDPARAKEPLRGTFPHLRWRESLSGARPIPPVFLAENELLTMTEQELQWRNWQTGEITRATTIRAASFTSAASSPDRRWLALAGGSTTNGLIQMYDLASGVAVGPPVTLPATVASVAFSSDGQRLISAGNDRTVRLWKVPSLEPAEAPTRLPDSVHHADFSPNGALFGTIEENGDVRVWRRPRAHTTQIPARHSLVAMSVDGRYVMAAGASGVDGDTLEAGSAETRVVDANSGKPAGPVLAPGGQILTACFLHGGKHVAVFCRPTEGAAVVHFLNWTDGAAIFPPVTLPADPRWCEAHDPSNRLAVDLADGQVMLFDLRNGTLERQWSAHAPTTASTQYLFGNGALRFSPDGSSLAFFGTSDSAEVFNPATGEKRFQLRCARRLHGLRFAENGQYLATAAFDGTVQVWNAATGEPIGEPLTHPDWAFDAVFSADGDYLLTTCRDAAARVWRWREGKLMGLPLRHRNEVHPAAFVPGGPWVVTASMDATAVVWDWTRGLPMTPPIPLAGRARNIQISPDGRLAAIGGLAEAFDLVRLDMLHSPLPIPLTSLTPCAELISCQRVEVGRGLENLSLSEWSARWSEHRESLRKLSGVPSPSADAQPTTDQAAATR